jgi:hypothetical protein
MGAGRPGEPSAGTRWSDSTSGTPGKGGEVTNIWLMLSLVGADPLPRSLTGYQGYAHEHF